MMQDQSGSSRTHPTRRPHNNRRPPVPRLEDICRQIRGLLKAAESRHDDRPIIEHERFAIRQLPIDVFKHYKRTGIVDDLESIAFYNKGGAPAVWVERGDGKADLWTFATHHAADKLPRQISKHYVQNGKLSGIKQILFYEDDENVPNAEVKSGESVDFWQWKPSPSGDRRKTFDGKFVTLYVWSLVSSEPVEEEEGEIEEKTVPLGEWELIETHDISDDEDLEPQEADLAAASE